MILVLDNIQGVCPKAEDQGGLIEAVKSQRITGWLLDKIEQTDNNVVICGICRHFSQLNPHLLDVGALDNLVEVTPPTKEQRYEVLKEKLTPEYADKEFKL